MHCRGALLMTILMLSMSGCFTQAPAGSSSRSGTSQPSGRASDAERTFPLDKMSTSAVTLGSTSVRVWLARTRGEQMEGLMHVPANELEGDVGMLFVFDEEEERFFWMKNTITALDIAYARSDGTIVSTYTMPPLTLQNFPSLEPAMFALEMKAGSFARLGVQRGQRIVIPSDVFQPSP